MPHRSDQGKITSRPPETAPKILHFNLDGTPSNRFDESSKGTPEDPGLRKNLKTFRENSDYMLKNLHQNKKTHSSQQTLHLPVS